MTIQEFKAWLDGFSEAIDEAPTPEQWAKIKEKIESLQVLRFPEAPTINPEWPPAKIGIPPRLTTPNIGIAYLSNTISSSVQ